jgi:hypothetical protein
MDRRCRIDRPVRARLSVLAAITRDANTMRSMSSAAVEAAAGAPAASHTVHATT